MRRMIVSHRSQNKLDSATMLLHSLDVVTVAANIAAAASAAVHDGSSIEIDGTIILCTVGYRQYV